MTRMFIPIGAVACFVGLLTTGLLAQTEVPAETNNVNLPT